MLRVSMGNIIVNTVIMTYIRVWRVIMSYVTVCTVLVNIHIVAYLNYSYSIVA